MATSLQEAPAGARSVGVGRRSMEQYNSTWGQGWDTPRNKQNKKTSPQGVCMTREGNFRDSNGSRGEAQKAKSLTLPEGGIACQRSERSVWQESKWESFVLASGCRGFCFPEEALDRV